MLNGTIIKGAMPLLLLVNEAFLTSTIQDRGIAGVVVGGTVGDVDGNAVELIEGIIDGDCVGDAVGDVVGDAIGEILGARAAVEGSGVGQVVSPHPQFAPLLQTLEPAVKEAFLCHLQ